MALLPAGSGANLPVGAGQAPRMQLQFHAHAEGGGLRDSLLVARRPHVLRQRVLQAQGYGDHNRKLEPCSADVLQYCNVTNRVWLLVAAGGRHLGAVPRAAAVKESIVLQDV